MKKIVRIIIKGSSGYCPVYEAYTDKVTLTPSSIAYEYIPEIETEINPKRKWSYKTNSPLFAIAFEKISEMMPQIIYNHDILMATDLGPISFTVTYEDKTREYTSCWCSGDNFHDLFKLIKQLVPQTEYIPAVLLTSDDYSDEEEEGIHRR